MSRFMLKGAGSCTICTHTLCMNHVTKILLFASKELVCFGHGQSQKREEKHDKELQGVGFHNHSPALTMMP